MSKKLKTSVGFISLMALHSAFQETKDKCGFHIANGVALSIT